MPAMPEPTEIIRSSFTLSGVRIFLVYDNSRCLFKLATRWYWLSSFDSVWDGCDAFEALELLDGDDRVLGAFIKREIKRVPRYRFANPNSMGRISYLTRSVERRMQGLKPQRCGSKGAVERWIAS
ncbi:MULTISPECIES: hypothetical protein [Pseudomonas]|uniref:hypothetical protein n=1 Tax=Pseudomonas TaxID=286 RepID=UPI0012E35F9E|nr:MULTISPECIES: hypothetical protein [Pseudomonas]WHS57610.1 hypothetical protein QLH64_30115 [Pseudomonas brassicacearum]